MSRIELADRITLIELYFKNGESVAQTFRAYKTLKNMKGSGDPFHRQTLLNLVHRFRETGNVADLKGRGRPTIAEDVVEAVNTEICEREGRTSVRSLQNVLQIPKSTIHVILKRHLRMRPYKFHIVPILTDLHRERRVQFSTDFLARLEENPNLLENVLFSDEATFYLNGTVSSHLFRIWSSENPNAIVEQYAHSPKITVWFAFSQKFRVTPYFFTGNVNGDSYRQLIQGHLVPFLKQHHRFRQTTFQQDGATPHTAANTIELLQSFFHDQLIALGTNWEWPANSPDLSPLDYFLWGYIKQKVYCSSPKTVSELQTSIETAIANIEADLLVESIESLRDRLTMCIAVNGGHYEHYS
jgi:hypothetical protein